jgi:glycosyltransferase involved in cell wall biosynthesis
MPKDRNALFVSYNAATEPLVKSQVLPYLSALSATGIKFFFLSFEKDAAQGHAISEELSALDISWIRLKFHNKPALFAKPFDILCGEFAVLRTCMTKKIGVVHARGIMGACISIIPAKLLGARFVFDMKSSLAEAYRLSGRIKKDSVIYRVIAALERFCVLHSDEVIVETNLHKNELEKISAHSKKVPRITVLPCCVDVKRFNENGDHDYIRSGGAMKLVYLGSLSGWYMIPEMLEFFSALKRLRPGSEFLFLSDDKDGSLGRLIKDKKLGGVIITKVPYDHVPKSLWGATAGVLFKWPNERLDSFPIKVAEYLAAGLPVVINSGMGDVEDMVNNNRVGVVVGSCDEEAYIRAINELASLVSEGHRLQQRCESVSAKELSSSFGLSVYNAIYTRLLA